jgi:Ca2+-binding RTX toxin-like protein
MPTITGTNNAETLDGTQFDDIIYGLGGGDTINGLDGNDFLDGGAGGGDRLYGGLGNDTYYVDVWNEQIFIQDSDFVFENDNEGFDRVVTSVTYRLTTQSVEVLEAINLTDTTLIHLYGNDYNQTIIGNAASTVLLGGGGSDVLIGGAGADTMFGDGPGSSTFGNDIFYVDNVGDHAIEGENQGFDRVYTTVSFTLEGEIEWLQAAEENGTDPLTLAGNEYAQTVIGNAGGNILYGQGGDDELRGLAGNDYLVGGAGVDTLRGGLGDDTYYVDSGDVIDESIGQGFDRVAASASFTVAAGISIELIEAVDFSATTAIDLGGNELAQRINGNAGVNILRGFAGDDMLFGYGGDDHLVGGLVSSSGLDQMFGGTGNDTYYVYSSSDVATEAAGEGNDRVATNVSYTLVAGSEIETLEAGNSGGTDAINLTGNEFANRIVGNAGGNIIDGKGGNDVLVGLGSVDTYTFTTALGPNNVDMISGFVPGIDRIALDDAIFTAVGAPGALSADAFVNGPAAADASDRIVYNGATGELFYDADGSGAIAQIQFATIGAGASLSAIHFIVI